MKRGLPDSEHSWLTIVGVVSAVRDEGDYDETWYLPLYQNPVGPSAGTVHLMVRGASPETTGLVAPIRRALAEVDRTLAVHDVATMESLRAEAIAEDRLSAIMLAVFAGFGLLLAGVGIYGVTAHGVKQRTREIGIRMALGAQPAAIRRCVIAGGLRLTAIGIGLLGAVSAGAVVERLIFETAPADHATLGGAAAGLAAVAMFACWIPARRATRVDPLTALRA